MIMYGPGQENTSATMDLIIIAELVGVTLLVTTHLLHLYALCICITTWKGRIIISMLVDKQIYEKNTYIKLYIENNLKLTLTSFNSDINSFIVELCHKSIWLLKCSFF